MGKSMVLKDLSGHAAGYVRVSDREALCGVRLNGDAQLALVLADGSSQVFDLQTGAAEQRFSCERKAFTGYYVFRGKELLLISGENMRDAFARDQLLRRKEASSTAARTEDVRKPAQQEIEAEAPKLRRQPDFPQRRWPPPPCWDEAQYIEGSWQEP